MNNQWDLQEVRRQADRQTDKPAFSKHRIRSPEYQLGQALDEAKADEQKITQIRQYNRNRPQQLSPERQIIITS
jgi:flagellar biosynthesis chaperone FliJ